MIEDKELDALEAKSKDLQTNVNSAKEMVPDIELRRSDFAKQMDAVKGEVLDDAKKNDEVFQETVGKNLREAAVKHTIVEQKKANLEEEVVEYQRTVVGTAQQQEEHQQESDVWKHKRERRQFVVDGVKPIMNFAGIVEPANIGLMIFLTIFLLPWFLLNKLWKSTVVALFAGAQDENRSKVAKGFIWTVIGLLIAFAGIVVIYCFCKWVVGVDIFAK